MEQTHFWMWKNKRKQYDLGYHRFQSSTTYPLLSSTGGGDSWEEQAFAEDAAAGALGGCVWPPRSYSCTFCKREFRSAQALGGHMNIHRRDRARMKQSQNLQTETTFPQNNCIQFHLGNILEAQAQHQICNYMFNPNNFATAPSSPIKVYSSAPRLNSFNKSQYIFPYVQEPSTIFPPPMSSLNLAMELESKSPSRAEGDNIIVKSENPRENPRRSNKGDIVIADLSISLNLVIGRNNNPSSDSHEYEDEDERSKRHRIDPAAALNLFNEDLDVVSTNELVCWKMNRRVSCVDDVDLELRLGDPRHKS